MGKRKEQTMIKLKHRAIALTLAGAVLFTTAAASELLSGDAYSAAKDAVKKTTSWAANEAESFTMDYGVVFKVDGEAVNSSVITEKYDMANLMNESREKSIDPSGECEWYRLTDGEIYVSAVKNSDEDDEVIYHVSDYGVSSRDELLSDPFEEEMAEDIETVFDAFVGSLKEFVQCTDEDGKIVYFGALDSSQIPALPNTLCSFLTKYTVINDAYTRDYYEIPEMDDIFLDSLEARVEATEDNIITSAYGNATLLGTGKDGEEHSIGFEVFLNITDVDSTQVEHFDPEGKNVERASARETAQVRSANIMDSYDIGTYKRTLYSKGDGELIPDGEITVTITECTDESIIGTYSDTKKGVSFNFVGEWSDSDNYRVSAEGMDMIIIKNYDHANGYSDSIDLFRDVTFTEGGWQTNENRITLMRVEG